MQVHGVEACDQANYVYDDVLKVETKMVTAARAGHLQVGHGRTIGRLWPKPIRRQQPKTPFFTGVFIAFFGCSPSAMKKHKRAFEKQCKTQKLPVENKKSWLSVPARVSADRLVAQLRQGGCLMGGYGLSRHYAAKALSGSLSEELKASTHVTVNYKNGLASPVGALVWRHLAMGAEILAASALPGHGVTKAEIEVTLNASSASAVEAPALRAQRRVAPEEAKKNFLARVLLQQRRASEDARQQRHRGSDGD